MRYIPEHKAVCPVCYGIYKFTSGMTAYHPNCKPRPSVIHTHGPRGNRCSGSRKAIVPWIVASELPTWDIMTELDKGCALLFVWKVHWEKSFPYAKNNYPCQYKEHPDLRSLDKAPSCRHARIVTGGYKEVYKKLGGEEFHRLYNMALAQRTVE